MTTLVETLSPTGTRDVAGHRQTDTSLVGRLVDWIAEQRRYQRTLTELSNLTDRELADIGVMRGDLEFVARHSARGT